MTQEPGVGTAVLEQIELDRDLRTTEDGDHERMSHYVPKDRLMEAMINGTPVVALCGKVWAPSRDPERFPVCPECKRIYQMMPHGGGNNEDR